MNNETKSETVVNANWANWALIAALDDKTQCRAEVVEIILARFQQTLGDYNNPNKGPVRYMVATNDGHWGRGSDLASACDTAKKAGAGRTAKVMGWLVLNDEKPYVDQMGTANASSTATLLNLGMVGTIGSVLNAQK